MKTKKMKPYYRIIHAHHQIRIYGNGTLNIINMKKYKLKKIVKVEQAIEVEGTMKDVIAYNVVRLRKLNGWCQDELSEASGISRPSLSNIEKGRHGLTLPNLEKLCIVFNCNSSDIIPF